MIDIPSRSQQWSRGGPVTQWTKGAGPQEQQVTTVASAVVLLCWRSLGPMLEHHQSVAILLTFRRLGVKNPRKRCQALGF